MAPTIDSPTQSLFVPVSSGLFTGSGSAGLKPTVVLGASDNPNRYSFRTVNRLRDKHHPVTAIGHRKARVADLEIVIGQPELEGIDTVTVYLNRGNQREYYDYILSLHPKRIIFNPGAENPELSALAKTNGIETVEGCTLVLLSTGEY
jgi:predicted CoA-binding protein